MKKEYGPKRQYIRFMKDWFDIPSGEEVFRTPDHYFEDFEARLAQRIDALAPETAEQTYESEEKVLKVPFLVMLKPYLYMAAMFVLVFFGLRLVGQRKQTSDTEVLSQMQESMEEVTYDEATAEEILMSELDEYSILYYFINQDEL